ncbi:sodium-dependent transporter [Pseudokordiimonas caeni]|uniref:sodium-dependent transporter n=1 Tax=Pseudokordiimonas caeni TaxID=2997908 RepID=UPI002811C583|nr:sodium-dependent transporter [Pseudokordiimonas caeni]
MAAGSDQANWSSRWTFIMAAVGSAVGLGNIWLFPFKAGQSGGAAFVLVYLGFSFLIGVPLLMTELSLGRRGRMSPIGSMKKIAAEEKRSPLWGLIGWSGVLGAFIILSFYSVVGGWTLAYMVKAAMGFQGLDATAATSLFTDFIGHATEPLVSHAIFMGITMYIVARGVQGGLEKAVSVMMPALFGLLVLLVAYAAFTGAFADALAFLFTPDFGKLTPAVVIDALGQSFFSLSLAMGSIMTYGAYLNRDVKIGPSALTIAAADSTVALLAGLAIFPIVFQFGISASGGPGLVFMSLPIAFGQMPGGQIIGTLFFALLSMAAITSSISLLEPAVSYLEHRWKVDRKKSALTIAAAAFALGVLSALGQEGNMLGNVRIFGQSIMDAKGYLTNNIMMPLGGMFTALFVGWFVSRKAMADELALTDAQFRFWYTIVRYVAPIAVFLVFLSVTVL